MPQFLKQYGEQLVALGYTVLPIRPGTKRPDLKNWPNHETTAADVVAWYSNGRAAHGAGINARNAPAIDVDVLDPDVAQQMSDAIDAIFPGERLMTRTGLAPKFLVPFRSDTPFRKMTSHVYTDGTNEHKVEILGDGQQWVAYHVHPDTGLAYSWWDGLGDGGIVDVEHASLPVLGRESAQLVIDAFERIAAGMVASGKWSVRSADRVLESVPGDSDDPFSGFAQPTDLTPAQVEWVVSKIRNDEDDYDRWFSVLCAVHHQLGDDGIELARAYSQRSSKHVDETFEAKYASLGAYKGPMATLRSFLKETGQPPVAKPKALETDRVFQFCRGVEYAEDFIGGPEIVEDVFPAQGTGMMFGPSGSGKTFWMLDLAFHVQNGARWRDKDVSKGDVMYVAAEAGRGIKKRIRGMLNAHPDWDAPFFADMAPDLSDVEWIKTIRDAAQAAGTPSMVVIDTMSASFSGDDSSQADVAPMIRNLTSLSQALDCFVVFVHHTTKERTSWRGSGAFFADVDAVLETVDSGEGESRKQHVVQRKHRDGEAGKEYPFRLVVTDPVGKKANGKDITTMLVEQTNERAQPEIKKDRKSTGGEFETSEKYGKARDYLRIIDQELGLAGDANIDEVDVISAIQRDEKANPLNEPDYPKASNIKRTLLTLAEKGKIRREGRWIRICR